MRIALLISVAAALAGCGNLPDEPQRVPVKGQVTYNGQPVAEGRIRFVPIAETKGPVSGGPIRGGYFSVDHKGGVPVGRHRVHIEAYRPDKSLQPDPIEGQVVLQYIPEKYNAKSTLEITVEPDDDDVTRDFDLR